MDEAPYEVFAGDYAVLKDYELPNELLALFTEKDRRVSASSEEEVVDDLDDTAGTVQSAYDVPVRVMRGRLEIMGISDASWRQELEDYVRKQIQFAESAVEREEIGSPARHRAERALLIFRQSSLERWMRKLLLLFDKCWNDAYGGAEDTLMHAMFDRHTMMPEPVFSRELTLVLRASLEALTDEDTITFDFSTAVYDDSVSADHPLSETARYRLLRPVREFDPVLVLTEGRTDAKIIKESFQKIRPEISHMFSYMEHEAFKAEGGTSALVSLARSFAAAGISNRVIFLFDNDTAGHEGLKRFQKEGLPKHYQGITLPYLRSAENYPTIGPTGEAYANVNGCACGIELYCGSKALTKDDGTPCGSVAKFGRPGEDGLNASGAGHVRVQVASF